MTRGELRLLDEGVDQGSVTGLDFIGAQVLADVRKDSQYGEVRVITVFGDVPSQDLAFAQVRANQTFEFNSDDTDFSIRTVDSSLISSNNFTYDPSTSLLTFGQFGNYLFTMSAKGQYQNDALCHPNFRLTPQRYNFQPPLKDGAIDKSSELAVYPIGGKAAWCGDGTGKGGKNNEVSSNHVGFCQADAGWTLDLFSIINVFTPYEPGLAADMQLDFQIRQLRMFYYD